MNISKEKLKTFFKELPENIDIEDVMYRLYLLQKIEAGELDIHEGRRLSHENAKERLSRKWRN
ncbi:MAG: hypothetical protein HY894_01195 [Deltaproteobacteria bacterium]|nr:hypothetical protein [Deltaproteobacteria bacterium]